MKAQITGRILEHLSEASFDVINCQGAQSSFDIIARKGDTIFLVKVLTNIEGLTPGNALELKRISSLIDAIPIVVGNHTKLHDLSDGVLYDRHGVRVMNVGTFGQVLSGEMPSVHTVRGNYCMNLNPEVIVRLRKKLGMTQQELADRICVSKQSIYRYESSGKISLGVAEELSKFFDSEDVFLPTDVFGRMGGAGQAPFRGYLSDLKRKVNRMFRQIGFSTSITNAPFDIIAKNGESVFSAVTNDRKRIERKIGMLEDISELLGGHSVCVSERRIRVKYETPVLKFEDLMNFKSTKELIEILD